MLSCDFFPLLFFLLTFLTDFSCVLCMLVSSYAQPAVRGKRHFGISLEVEVSWDKLSDNSVLTDFSKPYFGVRTLLK